MNANERKLFALLRQRYPADRWALFPTVQAKTWAANHADALTVPLWPSIGPKVHGFEFKWSRADWRRELRQEGKSDPVGRYCTYWWLVTPELKVARPEELPPGWGWLSAERPKRPPRELLQAERQAWRELVPAAGTQEAMEFMGEVAVAPPPPPVRTDLGHLTLWTVIPARQREVLPPDFELIASCARRAQQALGTDAGRDQLRQRMREAEAEVNRLRRQIATAAHRSEHGWERYYAMGLEDGRREASGGDQASSATG